MIELAELVAQLRAELDEARRAGANEDLRFELGPVELEVSVAVTRAGEAGAKIRFWVVEFGAEGSVSSASSHRFKLTLQPRLTAESAESEPEMSFGLPYVSGQQEPGER